MLLVPELNDWLDNVEELVDLQTHKLRQNLRQSSSDRLDDHGLAKDDDERKDLEEDGRWDGRKPCFFPD